MVQQCYLRITDLSISKLISEPLDKAPQLFIGLATMNKYLVLRKEKKLAQLARDLD